MVSGGVKPEGDRHHLIKPCLSPSNQFHFSMSSVAWASLVFQTLIVCVVGMLLWFWLLTVYPASRLGALCFLTPVFGIIFGVALLRESVDPQFILGATTVLAGILLVSGGERFARCAFPKRKFSRA
jgi:drug/metabolite transporter (DMT)-like permease